MRAIQRETESTPGVQHCWLLAVACTKLSLHNVNASVLSGNITLAGSL